jgi:hypothetical protein
MGELIVKYWGILLALVGLMVWLVRLEARSIQNEREIRRLWHQRKEDLEASKQAREDTNQMLKEIRDDIKALIANVGRRSTDL